MVLILKGEPLCFGGSGCGQGEGAFFLYREVSARVRSVSAQVEVLSARVRSANARVEVASA